MVGPCKNIGTMKYHYIYKTTLLCGTLAGKYYIGKHSTEQIPEKCSYAGSGVIVRDYFKKYGKIKGETYDIEILELNPDKYTNAEREREIVGQHLGEPYCLNIAKGGMGGGRGSYVMSEAQKKRISESLIGNPNLVTRGFKGKHHTKEAKEKLHKVNLGRTHIMPLESRIKASERMKGSVVPEETRRKISETLKNNICWNKLVGAKTRFIKQCDKNGKKIKVWDLTKECFSGFQLNHIKSCCNGERKTHKGFLWKWCIPVPFPG